MCSGQLVWVAASFSPPPPPPPPYYSSPLSLSNQSKSIKSFIFISFLSQHSNVLSSPHHSHAYHNLPSCTQITYFLFITYPYNRPTIHYLSLSTTQQCQPLQPQTTEPLFSPASARAVSVPPQSAFPTPLPQVALSIFRASPRTIIPHSIQKKTKTSSQRCPTTSFICTPNLGRP